MFLRNCSYAGLTALGLLSATGPAAAQDSVDLTVASFRAGSSWFVYSATIGEILRDALPEGSTIDTPPLGGGQANVMTYSQDGRQYVVVMAGGHHFMKTPVSDAIVAYALPWN